MKPSKDRHVQGTFINNQAHYWCGIRQKWIKLTAKFKGKVIWPNTTYKTP